jgi:hypothetical protein
MIDWDERSTAQQTCNKEGAGDTGKSFSEKHL